MPRRVPIADTLPTGGHSPSCEFSVYARNNRCVQCVLHVASAFTETGENFSMKLQLWRRTMRKLIFVFGMLTAAMLAMPILAAQAQSKDASSANSNEFKAEEQKSTGSVSVEGKTINYDAVAGTLVVHPKGWDDVPQDTPKDDKNPPVEDRKS